MIDSVYSYKTVVEDSQKLFPRRTLPPENIEELHKHDAIIEVIEKLRSRGNGVYMLKIQPSGGKSFSTAKYIAEQLEEGKTFIIFSKRQELLYQIQEDLIDEGLDPDMVNRLQGFQRVFPRYPAEDREGKLVEKDKEETTELEEKIRRDYKNGASPNWIVRKYNKELQLDSNPWKEQFEDYKGKVVLAPLDYLTKNMTQIGDIINACDTCFIDEVVQKPYSIELNTKPCEVKFFLQYMTSRHEELYEDARDDFIDDHDSIDSKTELADYLYGEGSALEQAQQIYCQLLHHTSPIRKRPEGTLDELIDTSTNLGQISYSITSVTPRVQISKEDLRIASDFLRKLKFKLYKEAEPEEYNRFLGKNFDLTQLIELQKYADYGKVEVSEKLKVHKEEEIKLNQKTVLEDDKQYQKGIFEKDGEPKAYIKIKDRSMLEDKLFEGSIITSEFKNNDGGYITKYQHSYQKILEHSTKLPTFLLDATSKPEHLTTALIQYAYNRRAELDRDSYHYWYNPKENIEKSIKPELNELDRTIIKELGLIEPYIPIFDQEALDNTEKIIDNIETDWRFGITEWQGLKVESECTNKDSTVIRLKSRYAQEPGSFSRTQSSFINTLEAKLKSGEVPAELEALGKEGYGIISYKGEIIEHIKKHSSNYIEEDVAYFYGLRGANHLKGQDALHIGTAYINPKEFKNQLRSWLEMDIDLETVDYVDGWYKYPDEVVQSFHEIHSVDEQYQAIHRSRLLLDDVTVAVMGRIPPAIREEVTVKTPSENSLKEYAVNLRFKTVLEEYGESDIVSKAKEQGVTPEELGVRMDDVGEVVMAKLSRLDEKLTFQHGELRKDKRYSDKDYHSMVEDYIEDNWKVLEGLSLTEFKQEVKKGVENASEERIDEVLEEMIDADIIKKYKVKDFPPAYQVSLRLKSQD